MSNIEDTAVNQMTFAEMKEQKEALERAMNEQRTNAQREAIDQIVQVAEAHDLTYKDIAKAMKPAAGTKTAKAKSGKAKASTSKAAAKYKDPNSDATWTGRGRKPKWFTEAEDAGVNTDAYLIGTPEAVDTTESQTVDTQPEADAVVETTDTVGDVEPRVADQVGYTTS